MYQSIMRTFSLSLMTATMLVAEISTADCAKGYDTINGVLKASALSDPVCQSSATGRPKSLSIKIIKNFDQIFDLMKIPKNKRFFKDPLVRKIIDNGYINHYTITVAYYEAQDLFTTTVTDTKLARPLSCADYPIYGDTYIKSVQSGARHLILYHIITRSEAMYRKANRMLERDIPDIESLKHILSRLAQQYEIRIKEYFTPGIDALTTSELEESFRQPEYFDRLVAHDALPYRYFIRDYPDCVDDNITRARERIKVQIESLLDGYRRYNDYRYYRRETEEFKPIDQTKKRKLCDDAERLSKLLRKGRLMAADHKIYEALKNIDLPIPPRFTSALPADNRLTIAPQEIALTIKGFAGKIAPEASIHLSVQSRLDLQNHGKILRVSMRFSIEKKKRKYHVTNKRILFDAYVDYPGLRFKSIQNSYGELSSSFRFDRYGQSREIKGRGSIDSAQCGYTLDTNGTLHASCKIVYKPIDIRFEHVENEIK